MSGALVLRAGRYRFAWLIALVAAVFGGATPTVAAPRPSLSVIVPIVSASTTLGAIDADVLEANTTEGGAWEVLATSAIEHGATIALDSRITASIHRLGDDAPASAVTWLANVERTNPLDLPWGNADPFMLAATAKNNRISAIQLSELSGVGALDIVGWPTGRAGDRSSTERVHALGFSTLIVDDRTFPLTRGALSASASESVAAAVQPNSKVDLVDLVARLLDDHTLRAFSMPRNPLALDPGRVAELLDALTAKGASMSRFIPVSTESLGVPVINRERTEVVAAVMLQHRFDRRVSLIGVNPGEIALPRLERVCVLAGLIDNEQFAPTARNYVRVARHYSDVVSVQQGAEYTILSNKADIPVTVTNLASTDITVTVAVRSQTGSMRVDEGRRELTIAAGSNEQVSIPVETVANGKGALVVTLLTAEGLDISGPIYLPVNVQAQWESVTLIIFVAFVGTILGVGIARQIRDRRRRA